MLWIYHYHFFCVLESKVDEMTFRRTVQKSKWLRVWVVTFLVVISAPLPAAGNVGRLERGFEPGGCGSADAAARGRVGPRPRPSVPPVGRGPGRTSVTAAVPDGGPPTIVHRRPAVISNISHLSQEKHFRMCTRGFFCTSRPKLRSMKFQNSDQIFAKTQFNL